jgi:hypothetical protein
MKKSPSSTAFRFGVFASTHDNGAVLLSGGERESHHTRLVFSQHSFKRLVTSEICLPAQTANIRARTTNGNHPASAERTLKPSEKSHWRETLVFCRFASSSKIPPQKEQLSQP